jgi:hypothetical protein
MSGWVIIQYFQCVRALCYCSSLSVPKTCIMYDLYLMLYLCPEAKVPRSVYGSEKRQVPRSVYESEKKRLSKEEQTCGASTSHNSGGKAFLGFSPLCSFTSGLHERNTETTIKDLIRYSDWSIRSKAFMNCQNLVSVAGK